MTYTCTSCGEPFPLYTMPDYDPQRDTFDVCDDCVQMSRLRREREEFARAAAGTLSPVVQRFLAGTAPAKVLA